MSKSSSGNLAIHPLPYRHPAAWWFAKIRHLPLPVLLASGSSRHPAARYDILAAAPRCTLRTTGAETLVDTGSGEQLRTQDDPFTVLARYCSISAEQQPTMPPLPFTGGAIGYFGYELLHAKNHIDHTGKPPIGLPDMLAGIYDWAVILDHQLEQTVLVCRDLSHEKQQQLLALLHADAVLAQTDFRLLGPFVSNYTRDEYLQRFGRIIDYIHAGDCYQVNLAQCFTARCEGDSWQAFQRLQNKVNAPFAAYLEDGQHSVLSFSPERFIRVQDKAVLTQPIKGTRPRSMEPLQDVANRLDLEASAKDRAENLMIVDLLRNDLGRVCQTGSVSVENLFETQSFTNVHHLVSTIKGRLVAATDVFKLLQACFPGGSITGTPKKRAMEIINELETRPRSVYCGAIAYIDHSGNMDSNIAIRTLVRSRDEIHCWGGGGIVADSQGDEEFQETFDKISIFIKNLQQP
jgi:para-aminobenzoate synthetase component 1